MGANLASRYRLTADLDASATNATASSAGVFGAGGFVPVGIDTARFTGSLDGAGHTVTGLTIVRPSQDYVGLIGALGTGGSMSGLGLVGGSVAGHNFVAASSASTSARCASPTPAVVSRAPTSWAASSASTTAW